MESAEQTRWLSLPPRSWWGLWLSAFVGWTAYGLLYAHQVMSMAADMGKQYAWADVLRTSLVGMWGWVPLTVSLSGWCRACRSAAATWPAPAAS